MVKQYTFTKKLLFYLGNLILVMFLFSLPVVFAQEQYSTYEGETVTLETSITGNLQWRVISGGPCPSNPACGVNPFSNQAGSSIDFMLPFEGTFEVQVNSQQAMAAGSETFTVVVQDVFADAGFGHSCASINTSNCGDMTIYGSVFSNYNIGAENIYSSGDVWALGSLLIGSPVSIRLSESVVELPDTYIEGDLNFSGNIYSQSGLVTIDDDVEITNTLNVSDSTYLYKVQELNNPGSAISIDASLLSVQGDILVDGLLSAFNGASILGDMIVQNNIQLTGNLEVGGDADVTGNVRLSDPDNGRLMGSVVLDGDCTGTSTQIYQSGDDTIIELGVCN